MLFGLGCQMLLDVEAPFTTEITRLTESGSLSSVKQSGAWTFRVPSSVDPYYLAQTKSDRFEKAIEPGDRLRLSFSLKSSSSSSATGKGRLEGYIQSPGPPWKMLGRFAASAGAKWEKFDFDFTAAEGFKPGTLEAAFHLGQYKQELSLKNISWTNYGKTLPIPKGVPHTYHGREASAPWRKEAERKIRENRQSETAFLVVDAKGQPISGAEIQLTQTGHSYGFGTFLDTSSVRRDEIGERYRGELLKRFNLVTVPMFDIDWGWQVPDNQRQWRKMALWAKAANLRRRGTNILVPGWRWSPAAWRSLENSPAELEKVVDASILQRTTVFADAGFEGMDAYSEPRANPEFSQIFGWKKLADWVIRSKEIMKVTEWSVNEDSIVELGGHTEKHIEALKSAIARLREHGAPINAIALECRFNDEVTPIPRVWEILDDLGSLGLPILATELMIDTQDEHLQADYLRDFITAFFAHPKTTALVQWGFWEGQHWNPNAALLRKDWTKKQAAVEYDKLIWEKWRTNPRLKSDRLGRAASRLFHGSYMAAIRTRDGVSKQAFQVLPNPHDPQLNVIKLSTTVH